jgi:MFS family permease
LELDEFSDLLDNREGLLGKRRLYNGWERAGQKTGGHDCMCDGGFWLWLAMRCLWGISWTILRIGGLSLVVSASVPSNRGELMGIYNGLYRLGSLGGMLAGAFLATVYDLQTASFVFAACTVPALVLIGWHLPRSFAAQEEVGQAGEGMHPFVWKSGHVRLTLMSGFLLALAYQGVFASTLSRLFAERPSMPMVGGWIISTAVMASWFQAVRWGWEPWAAPLCGRLADRCGKKPLFLGAMLASAGLFAFLYAPVPFPVWICMLLAVQLTATLLTTLMDTWAAEEASRQPNHMGMMTLYTVVSDAGAAAGPLIAFWLDGQFGLSVVYGGMGGVLLLLALFWIPVFEARPFRHRNTL